MADSKRLNFEGSQGATLSARLDLPSGPIRAYAIFAHCFTCSKDFHATKRIADELAELGLAVLRFDFTGLGNSGGDFASTNFSSNMEDLRIAADYLREHYKAPSLLIGHSLGGAAVLSMAADLPEVKAVATIGAPAEAEHVVHNFGAKLDEIMAEGSADVSLAGRTFSIRKQFIDDLSENRVLQRVSELKKPLLVMHSPLDATVGVENATQIFVAAKHPKSFVSLDKADHLISSDEDAKFVAGIISAWAENYIKGSEDANMAVEASDKIPDDITRVTETGRGKFQNQVQTGGYSFLADEPKSVGGLDTGPTPYDFLTTALGTCTTMTLRMYADFKKLDLGRISVDVSHAKIHAKDCEACTADEQQEGGKIDVFERVISVEGMVDDALKDKLVEIADKCPVHKTIEKGGKVKTSYSA